MIRTIPLSVAGVFALALTACVVVSPESDSTSAAPHGSSSVAGLEDLVGV